MNNCKTLEALWKYVERINNEHFKDNKLKPILGNGKTKNPKIMFVFINPTIRNISSDNKWVGPRFPFIGTKQIWRIFCKVGLFDARLLNIINKEPYWSLEFTNKVLEYLKQNELYITNVVKWTGKDATLPDSKKIKLFLPILKKEIEIVKPKYIITFGLIPFEALTKQKIKLKDYFENSIKNNSLKYFEIKINNTNTKIIPCYFPTGRGDPKKAIEILKLMKKLK